MKQKQGLELTVGPLVPGPTKERNQLIRELINEGLKGPTEFGAKFMKI